MTSADPPADLNIESLPEPGRRIAVAIRGELSEGGRVIPPRMLASGYGQFAGQILDMAAAKGIKVRVDADLAELLAMLDLDTPIPGEAILAVAEILARVYQANARVGARTP